MYVKAPEVGRCSGILWKIRLNDAQEKQGVVGFTFQTGTTPSVRGGICNSTQCKEESGSKVKFSVIH